ncbi:MAG: flagellar type III secretion system pore protein FliP [Myxococcota bacterium]
MPRLCRLLPALSAAGLATLAFALLPALAEAQPQIQLTVGGPESESPEQVVGTLKVLGLLTVLSIAPGILISMTSFTRLVIVLSFIRQAMGTQTVPPMQVILSLALLLTVVIMAPVAERIDDVALEPYLAEEIGEEVLYERGSAVLREFLLSQTRESDLLLFYDLTETPPPDSVDAIGLKLLVPAFMVSELRTGFEMGFLLFLPFVLVDLVVASILTAMGMVMLPPTMISTPMKLLVFVAVDGWSLLTRSLVASFGAGG